MKRTTLGFLTVLLTGYGMSAREISPSEAMSVASDFMNSTELRTSASATSALRPMMAPGVNADAQASPYYVFNRGESDGFVIISGDDRAPKILGYSDRGSFDGENLPPQLKAMMEQWTEHMEQLPEGASQHASWSKGPSTRAGEGILLETAEWGQGYPYNVYCPIIESEQAPAGCVATAMAIAMKYHNWPENTRGGDEYDYYHPELTFDFDSYSIDWDVLSDQKNPLFAEQVSKLTYSAGVAAQMAYGLSESAAVCWHLGHLFQFFYAYDKDCQVIPRSEFDDQHWNGILHQQLEEVGPVVYYGNGEIGHCFVVDGYDAQDLYHVNWGWDGMLNGYFSLDFSIDGGMSFNQGQGMVINIKPDKSGKQYSRAWIPNCEAYIGGDVNGWNFMNSDIIEGQPNTFKAPSICISQFRGWIGLAIVDDNDDIVSLVDNSFMQQDGFRYFCSLPGTPMFTYTDFVLPTLKDGERYQLISQECPNLHQGQDEVDNGYYPALPPTEDPADWYLVQGGIIHPSYFYATGNRSDVAEIRYHIDESMPSYFMMSNSYDHDLIMKRLKGGDGPENIVVPRKGVTLEVKAFDQYGTPKDPLYLGESEEYPENHMGINISVYEDIFEVNIKYEFDGDTRRDNGIPSDQLVEKDGLIYKKDNNRLILIGYDDVGDNVVIPNSISVDGIDVNVTDIEAEALLHAPIKHLSIQAPSLNVGTLAMANMKKLETLSSKTTSIEYEWTPTIFTGSSLKTIYLDSIPTSYSIFTATTGLYYYNENLNNDKLALGVKNLEFVLSDLPDSNMDSSYFNALRLFQSFAPDDIIASAIDAYLIPGIGEEAWKLLTQGLVFNIEQMWKYEIDKENGLISIKDVLEKVTIDKVVINGIEVTENLDGLYEVPINEDKECDVVVEYTINGSKKVSTHYTNEYNSRLVDSILKEAVTGDANNDGIVTVADAVNAANYIVGLPTTEFSFEMADVNSDGNITVSDVTSIIALIPLQSYTAQASNGKSYIKDEASGYLVSSQSIVDGQIELSLASDEKLTAIQFDLQVSVGTSIPVIMLSDKVSSTHSIKTFMMDSNTVRVIVYSANGNLLSNNATDHILNIKSTVSAYELMFENIFASSISGQSISLGHEGLSDTNGVQDSPIGMPKVSSANGRIVVENAEGLSIDVYSLDGSCVDRFVSKSERVEIPSSQGMYIVTVDNSSYKVIIR